MKRHSFRPALALCAALALSAWTAPAPAQEMFTADQVRADFDALYAGLQEAHYDLFAETPRAVFDQRHGEMRRAFDRPMTRLEMEVEFQRFIALGRIGHARIDAPIPAFGAHLENGGRMLPLRFRIREGALFAGNSAGEIRAGDEILELNGRPAAFLLAERGRNVSAETPRLAHTIMERIGQVLFWIEYGAPERVDVTVKREGGRLSLQLDLLSWDDMPYEDEAKSGFSLEGREARMINDRIAYLRPGPFFNASGVGDVWDNADFLVFLDAAFAEFIAAGATDLILDLRDNPGGDVSFSDPVLAWFADQPFSFYSRFQVRVSPQSTAANQARLDGGSNNESSRRYGEAFAAARNGEVLSMDFGQVEPRSGPRFEGRVHALINRYSYSNAVTTAAIIQDYGFGRIIGEATADMATTYGAMERFTLPHSGIEIGYPKALIIRPNGDAHAHGVTPDIALHAPLMRGPRDVMLEAAIALISEE